MPTSKLRKPRSPKPAHLLAKAANIAIKTVHPAPTTGPMPYLD